MKHSICPRMRLWDMQVGRTFGSCSGDEDSDAFMRGLMGMRKGTNGRWRQRRPDRILEGRVWELAFGVVGVRGANRRAQRCGAERRSYGI
mmetsp:Transcript_8026/g.12916  ORF Transcript_8026/g.12916 Transcript_8026/m.12916 type:complete len:90 (-) Transcript_8026:120-389(-)